MFDGRLRSGVAAVAVVVAALVGSGACSDGGSDSGAPPATTTSTSAAPTGSTAVPGDVTVRGQVLTIFSSAQVLQLDPPVDGYSRVALTSDTEYRRADGSSGSLADIGEGSTVEVTGSPGATGTVIARRVTLVG